MHSGCMNEEMPSPTRPNLNDDYQAIPNLVRYDRGTEAFVDQRPVTTVHAYDLELRHWAYTDKHQLGPASPICPESPICEH